MIRVAIKVVLQAAGIVAASATLAIATDLVRSDGIPLVTDIEYEIFAPCMDSEAESQAAGADDLAAGPSEAVVYVDARPAAAFAAEHVDGSLSIPYSVLFGASDQDIDKVRQAAEKKEAVAVIVYGIYADPADTDQAVDLAKPLAQQLIEAGLAGVKHLEGGLEELKKSGVETVKKGSGTN
jgi:rhodanese-related sulfurtransferase